MNSIVSCSSGHNNGCNEIAANSNLTLQNEPGGMDKWQKITKMKQSKNYSTDKTSDKNAMDSRNSSKNSSKNASRNSYGNKTSNAYDKEQNDYSGRY